MMAVMATVDVPLFTGKRQDRRFSASLHKADAAMLDRAERMRELQTMLDSRYADWRRLGERRVLFETRSISIAAASAELRQNQPNPFNPSTTISFVLPERAHATLAVYSAGGSLVRTLWDGPTESGLKEVTWDGRDHLGARVSSGVYFYRLGTGSGVLTRKMVLLK